MKPGQFSFSDNHGEASRWRDMACVAFGRAGVSHAMLFALGVSVIAPTANASLFHEEAPVPVMHAPTPQYSEAQLRNAADAPRFEQRHWGPTEMKLGEFERSATTCAKVLAGKKVRVEFEGDPKMTRVSGAHALNCLAGLGAIIVGDEGSVQPDYTVKIEAGTRGVELPRISGGSENMAYPEVSVVILPHSSEGVYVAADTESLGESTAQVCAYRKDSVVSAVFERAMGKLAAAQAMRERIGTGLQRDLHIAEAQAKALEQTAPGRDQAAPDVH